MWKTNVFFELRHANAEVIELLRKLRREPIERCPIRPLRIARESLCDHLRHLVARDDPIAEEGTVAVTFDHAVRRELSDRVIRPMSARNVAERIRRSKCRRRRPQDECRRQCRC